MMASAPTRRGLCTALLAAAIPVALALAPGTALAGFGSEFSPNGGNTGAVSPSAPPPQIGFDSHGGFAVVGGGAGSEFEEHNSTGKGNFVLAGGDSPSLAVAPNGSAIVAWRSSDGKTVYYAYRTAGGEFPTNYPFSGSFSGAAIDRVAAGIDSSGNAVIAWKDSGIHYAMSHGATFTQAKDAPLGTPTFQGRASDPPRDNGPRAFRDNAGNVVLVYRDGTNVEVARRTTNGTWSHKVVSPFGMYDVKADADPISGRLVLGMSGGSAFRIYDGKTSTATGERLLPSLSGGVNAAVDVAPGGDAVAAWSDGNTVRSASCVDGYASRTVASTQGVTGLGAAVTTKLESVVAISGNYNGYTWIAGVRRGAGTFAVTPLNNTESGGVMSAAADYGGGALLAAVTSANTMIGYRYSSSASRPSEDRCLPPPPPPSKCTDQKSDVAKCADPSAPAAVCGPTDSIFPQCHLPTILPEVCGASNSILVACQSKGPYVAACDGLDSILPQCNLPPPKVPEICGGTDSILPPCKGYNNTVTVCGPTNSLLPACNFKTLIAAKPLGLDANGDAQGEVDIDVRCSAPDLSAADLASASNKKKAKTCKLTTAAALVRDTLLKAAAISAESWAAAFKEAAAKESGYFHNYRPQGEANARAFLQRAERIAAATLKVPPGRRAVYRDHWDELINPAGSPPYEGPPEIHYQSQSVRNAVYAWDLVMLDSVEQYNELIDSASKSSLRQTATVAPTKALGFQVKRAKLKQSKKLHRVRLKLKPKLVKALLKAAGKARYVPLRIVVSFKGKPRPVVRIFDIRMPVKHRK